MVNYDQQYKEQYNKVLELLQTATMSVMHHDDNYENHADDDGKKSVYLSDLKITEMHLNSILHTLNN